MPGREPNDILSGADSLEEATDWFLSLKDAPDDDGLRAAFGQWLAANAEHRAAWEKACAAWTLIGAVPPVHDRLWQATPHMPANVVSLPGRGPRRKAPWKRVAMLAAVAAVAACAWIAAPVLLLRMEADHLTRTAETRQITLDDGSIVTLGGQSAIAVVIEKDQRRVWLLAGEAFFEVAHDPDRPFVVSAGGIDATVLGTKFDMQLNADTTRVDLAEGALRVSATGDPVLQPGDSVTVRHGTGAFTRETVAPDDIASWREGSIFVTDVAIATVIDQIRRYHPAWINVTDSTLAAQRVTGLYDLRDPDRALRALVQPHGGTVRQVSPWVVLVSRW